MGSVLDGIREQVHHDLLDTEPVPRPDDGALELQRESATRSLELLGEAVRDPPRDGGEIDLFQAQLEPPHVDAGDIEELLDQLRQPLQLVTERLEHSRNRAAELRLQGLAREGELQMTGAQLHGGEGRLELVRSD